MIVSLKRLSRRTPVYGLLVAAAAAAACEKSGPAAPSAPAVGSPPSIVSVSVTGKSEFIQRGQALQLHAVVTLSNGFTEDRTGTAAWTSSNPAVVAITPQGIATAGDEGEATLRAAVENQDATLLAKVRYQKRTPDPAPGKKLPLPNVYAQIQKWDAERPGFIRQSCPNGRKYENNPWLDYIVDRLRTLDTRWGYNGKPTRTAADNDGFPVIAAGDEVAYHYGSGDDEGSTEVYLIDLILSHCGSNPRLTYREFTGEEPGVWTGAGRF